jgi:hypothetical protein
MTGSNQVAIRETTPAMLLSMAIDQGADLDRLEKLMLLQERWESTNARKAYSQAMAGFKANPPEIEKDRKVAFGNTKYSHATLGNVTDKINSALSQHGLSVGWTTKQEGKSVTVTCRITHVLGHYEETSLTADLDTSGAKNSIQALGSTITYLARYTVLALTGLATKDQDNDGAGTVEYISDKQLSTICDLINGKDIDQAKFLKYMGCETLEQIQASDFNKAINSLKAAKGKA